MPSQKIGFGSALGACVFLVCIKPLGLVLLLRLPRLLLGARGPAPWGCVVAWRGRGVSSVCEWSGLGVGLEWALSGLGEGLGWAWRGLGVGFE